MEKGLWFISFFVGKLLCHSLGEREACFGNGARKGEQPRLGLCSKDSCLTGKGQGGKCLRGELGLSVPQGWLAGRGEGPHWSQFAPPDDCSPWGFNLRRHQLGS